MIHAGYAGQTEFENARCAMVVECLEDILRPMFAVKAEKDELIKVCTNIINMYLYLMWVNSNTKM